MGSGVVFVTLSTITSSCALILTNKYLMSSYDFHWPISLTVFHFFVTYILLEIMKGFKLFPVANNVPKFSRWLLALYNALSIGLQNVNLKTNSIGFYQLSKLATIPVMVIINFIVYKKKTPFRTLVALAILLAGLYAFSIHDVEFNVTGTIFAAVGVLSTCACQFYNNQLQKRYKVGGTSLQHITSIQQTVLAFIVALIFEPPNEKSVFVHHFSKSEIIVVIATGLIAVCSNVSGFAFIGKTSPVTFQVVGHVKTLLIFVIGLWLFPPTHPEPRDQKIKKLAGFIVGIFGTILYSTFEYLDKTAAEKKANEKRDESETKNTNSSATDESNISRRNTEKAK